jgi:hypothetical protein
MDAADRQRARQMRYIHYFSRDRSTAPSSTPSPSQHPDDPLWAGALTSPCRTGTTGWTSQVLTRPKSGSNLSSFLGHLSVSPFFEVAKNNGEVALPPLPPPTGNGAARTLLTANTVTRRHLSCDKRIQTDSLTWGGRYQLPIKKPRLRREYCPLPYLQIHHLTINSSDAGLRSGVSCPPHRTDRDGS